MGRLSLFLRPHHHISRKYLGAYTCEMASAREMAWREDSRRWAAAAPGHSISRVWAGYWQRGR
jgi:hypothetical protein